MRLRRIGLLAATAALAGLVVMPAPASGQTLFQGRIDVTVEDATGARLPGATVDVTGPTNLTMVSDAGGEARFLNLAPGTYQVRVTLPGFVEYLNTNVVVGAGVGVPLRVTLRVAGVAEAVEVTAESPVIDTRRQTTATNVTLDELQNIPSSRDPWVVLQTVPSVIVDRVNVGGAESGQQSEYMGKGSSRFDNVWTLDGIPITDMAATGASPTYYDFDSFQEMRVTTGGADITSTTPGVQLDMILKQGTNTPRGSARVYFSNEDMQSKNIPDDIRDAVGGLGGEGNRTEQYADYGFEFGGPLVRDRLWAWGSLSRTDVRILTLIDTSDRTILENYSFKSQGQINDSTRASFTFFRGDKIKIGRDASPTRPPETTWDQKGPTNLYKGEANFVIGQNLFLTARGAYADMGFELVPQGGLGAQPYRDAGLVWHNSYLQAVFTRPQKTIMADGNWFLGRHEFKFGAAWRTAESGVDYTWGPDFGYTVHLPAYDQTGQMVFVAFRKYDVKQEAAYTGFYLGDTITYDRLALNLGLRVDHAAGHASEITQRANPLLPGQLPQITAPEVRDAVTVTAPTPRLGVTYALDDSRKTLARASYSMFGSQLAASQGGFVSGASYAWMQFLVVDANRNGITDPEELAAGVQAGFSGFDPSEPTATRTFNRIDPDLGPGRTHEVVLGLDRELMPHFGVSGSVTWRRFNDVWWTPLIDVRRPDYIQAGTLSGTGPAVGSFNVPFYRLDSAKVPTGAGRELTNREGYHQSYVGFELQATKRMADRWMARIGFSTNSHREFFTDPDRSMEDPTPTQEPASTLSPAGPLKHGGQVVRQAFASGKSQVFLVQPRYQLIVNGLYQGPWGLNFGVNMLSRQGFGRLYYQANVDTGDPLSRFKNVLLVDDVDDNRLPGVTMFDARVSKVFRFAGRANAIVDLDVFNLGNLSTVLGRQYAINAFPGPHGPDQVLEIMNPRILRLGLRLNF